MPRLRGQPPTKDKLLDTMREAMSAQPAHADQQKVSLFILSCPRGTLDYTRRLRLYQTCPSLCDPAQLWS